MANKLSLIFVVLAFLSGCGDYETERKVQNIQRIFRQDDKTYILFTQEPGSSEVKTLGLKDRLGKIQVVPDVKFGQTSWVEFTSCASNKDGYYYKDITLHIHDLNQIESVEDGDKEKKLAETQKSP